MCVAFSPLTHAHAHGHAHTHTYTHIYIYISNKYLKKKTQINVACLLLACVSISKDNFNKMRIIYIQFLHCVALEFVAKMSRDFACCCCCSRTQKSEIH